MGLSKAEFAKLALAAQQDPQPLMERLFQIATKGLPGQALVAPLRLNKPQQLIHDAVVRQRQDGRPPRVIVLKSRQPGVSTLAAGYVTATALTRPYSNSMVVAHLEDAAQKLYKKCQFMLERLPQGFKPRITAQRRNELTIGGMPCDDGEVQLGSSIYVGAASGSELWRGMTLTTVHISELAYFYYAESAIVGILQAVPMTPESLVVIESTANGVGNVFHEEWLRAESGESDFTPVFIPWWDLPDATMRVPADFELELEEREMKRAYGLSNEQVQWRRYVLYSMCRGDSDFFDQEYPATAAKAFLVTGRPAFNVKKLQEMFEEAQKHPGVRMIVSLETGIRMAVPRGPLTVYREPIPGHDYTIGCDPSSGVEGGDFGCLQVLDRTTSEQVAVWHGYIAPVPMAKLSVQLGLWYNTALVVPELSGGHGFSMVEELKHLQYPRIYVWQRVDKIRHSLTNYYGWETSYRTRPLLIDSFNFAVNEGEVLLRDADTIQEALNFQYVTHTRAEGAGGHDDRVMAFLIAYRSHLEWPMPDTGVPPRVRLEQKIAVDDKPKIPPGSMNKDAWEEADEVLKEAQVQRNARTEYDNPDSYEDEDGPDGGGASWVDWIRY